MFFKRCKFKTQKATNLSVKIANEFEAKLFYLKLYPGQVNGSLSSVGDQMLTKPHRSLSLSGVVLFSLFKFTYAAHSENVFLLRWWKIQ